MPCSITAWTWSAVERLTREGRHTDLTGVPVAQQLEVETLPLPRELIVISFPGGVNESPWVREATHTFTLLTPNKGYNVQARTRNRENVRL